MSKGGELIIWKVNAKKVSNYSRVNCNDYALFITWYGTYLKHKKFGLLLVSIGNVLFNINKK